MGTMEDMTEMPAQSPVCSQCNRELAEWVGNVMVPRDELSRDQVTSVEVWCKACSREDDEHQNIWELTWVRDISLSLAWSLVTDLSSSSRSWSKEALNSIYALFHLAHGDLVLGPLGALLERVERDSAPGVHTKS